jgi:hypothetical protein
MVVERGQVYRVTHNESGKLGQTLTHDQRHDVMSHCPATSARRGSH